MLRNIATRTKLALGSVLATGGALGIVLSLLLGWSEASRPWGFLLGFADGVVTGLGAALSIAGLLERKLGN
jgi:predicted ABC-type sugar transport system permease subunit